MERTDRHFVDYTNTTRRQTVTEGIMTAWHAQSRYSLVLTGSVDVTKDKAETDLAKYRYFDDCLAQAVYQLYTDGKDIYYPSSRATTLYFDRANYNDDHGATYKGDSGETGLNGCKYLWTANDNVEWSRPILGTSNVEYTRSFDGASANSTASENLPWDNTHMTAGLQSNSSHSDALQIWTGIQKPAGINAAHNEKGRSRFPRDSMRNFDTVTQLQRRWDNNHSKAKLDYMVQGSGGAGTTSKLHEQVSNFIDGGDHAADLVREKLQYNVGFRLPESILGPEYWKKPTLYSSATASANGYSPVLNREHGDSNAIGGHGHLSAYKFWDPKGTFLEIPYSTGMSYYDQVDGTRYRKMVPLFMGQKQELKQYDIRASSAYQGNQGDNNSGDQSRSFPNYYVQAWCLPTYDRKDVSLYGVVSGADSNSSVRDVSGSHVEGDYGSRMRARVIDNIYAGIGRNDTLTFTATLFRAVPSDNENLDIGLKSVEQDTLYDPYRPEGNSGTIQPPSSVVDGKDGVANGVAINDEQFDSTRDMDFYSDYSVTLRHYSNDDGDSAFGYNENYANNLVFPQNGWTEIIGEHGRSLKRSKTDADGAIAQNNLQHLVEYYYLESC